MTDPEPPEPSSGEIPADVRDQVESIAERYLAALQRGESPNRQALLEAHPEIAALLEQRLLLMEMLYGARPPGAPPDASPPPPGPAETIGLPEAPSEDEGHPGNVGPYKIREVLGEGGMGVVYLADQTEPVRRRVALKLIRVGMDTKDVVARFETERQALALMNHPHIARVYDAGATETGRPYFVMEHVPGVPITEYCDRHRLTTPERLALFRRVCDGVQHAHQKGVIHRDIKPSNVLVTANGAPVPKIIDFGVAKATDRALTERTLHTERGRVLGTLEYMSPEQAEMTSLDIDSRTDVYSLGIVLYELLVGTLPFDPHELREQGYDEVRRRIREEEPPKPSTRISTLGEDSAELARRRRTDPRGLARVLRGDLDWIVMRALEKDRTRRYATASELAAEIERHLNDEPVLAGPPSAAYRVKKFVRKHKGAVAAAAVVLGVLVAGLAGTTWMYLQVKAEREEVTRAWEAEADRRAEAEEAREKEAEQRAEAELQREAALAAQTRAEAAQDAEAAQRLEAEQQAENAQAVTNHIRRILGSVDPGKEGREVRVADVLDKAGAEIEEDLAGHPEVEGAVRNTLGVTYHGLGLWDEAETHLRVAVRLRTEELGEDHRDTLESVYNLAAVLADRGEYGEAERILRDLIDRSRESLGEEHEKTLERLAGLASVLQRQEKLDAAEPILREVLEAASRTLGEDGSLTLSVKNSLGVLYLHRGKLVEAEALLREVYEVRRSAPGEEGPLTLTTLINLGGALGRQRKYDEAEPLLRRALESCDRVLGEEHPDTLMAKTTMAQILMRGGAPAEAEPLLREILDARKQHLGDRHPATLQARNELGSVLLTLGRLVEAEPVYRDLLDVCKGVFGEKDPRTLITANNLAVVLRDLGRLADAEPLFREVHEGMRTALGAGHRYAISSMFALGVCLSDQGKLEEAEPLLRDALEAGRRALGPDDPVTLQAMNSLAGLLMEGEEFGEAEEILRQALAGWERTVGWENKDALIVMQNLGLVLCEAGRPEEAEPYLRRAIETSGVVLPEDHWRRGQIRGQYGGCLARLERYEEAERHLLRGVEILRDRLGQDHERTRAAIEELIGLYTAWGKPEKAEEARALLDSSEGARPEE